MYRQIRLSETISSSLGLSVYSHINSTGDATPSGVGTAEDDCCHVHLLHRESRTRFQVPAA
jgi:hypothetical protein